MTISEERREQYNAATERAKATLKPGDRIRATRCGGIVATYTFDHWCGQWACSKSGIDDIHVCHILKVNGEGVDFMALPSCT